MEKELSEQIHELDKKLVELKAEFKAAADYNQRTCEQFSKFASDVRTIVINGNGQPGLITRVDRIEQKEKWRDVIRTGGVLAVVGLLIKEFWSLFGG